ncbi:MAG: DsbC family protein [Sterolibacteriaceae bacterium]|jgi:thiol:disulfide interchange protein DsbC|nr:DsbC family protein [Sterolibacteriaceae bacterium]MBK9086484.1 DsbC family protein [Sterolibacteriaceae bacterium]
MKHLLRALAVSAAVIGGLAHADDASIKKAVEEKLGGKVDAVNKSGYLGLYEVFAEGNIFYTDEKVSAIFAGNLIDTKNMQNVTQERLQKLSAIKFSELPLDLAVKTVRGKGTRVFATFEDPNCGYCKRFAKDLQNVDDITIYTFLYPILSADSEQKAKQIWCAPDKTKAWLGWMIEGNTPTGDGKCNHPTEKVKTLGEKLRVSGTPTIFFSNGERVSGAVPAAQLDKRLKQVAEAK